MIITRFKGKRCSAPDVATLRQVLKQAAQAAGFIGIYVAGCAVGQALTR